ncbi:helix-turn-helix transcriptional regulator [Lentzea sp. CC55]|uniref:helix-turn-helix domain-containing protein n=1 Tax=Lentzea sp. CC55 TaxID=2884909 RepID=UPI0027E1F4C3|nr:helix-turn-helix transcriptional regulator [Lentzea sp. CC55]
MQTPPEPADQPKELVESMLGAVGPRLRDLRQRRQLKLSDVAKATGLSTSTLSRLESGHRRPTLDVLIPWPRSTGSPWTTSSARHPRATPAST